MKCPDPRNQETLVSRQYVHIAIIWHLSLRVLTDCTQRCDLGSGYFNLHPQMARPRVLKIPGLLISFHRDRTQTVPVGPALAHQ